MKKGIYFFCYPSGPPHRAGYQHQIVNLAEGLKALDIPFYSNVDYWMDSLPEKTFLLQANAGIDYYDCDAVVFSAFLILYNGMHLLPKDLFNPERAYKLIFIDDSDGLITPGYELHDKVDIVLKSHYNRKYRYPKNFKPWQFGLSNRIINAVSPKPFHERKKNVLFNFRISHSIRDIAKQKAMPLLYNHLAPDFEVDNIEENTSREDQLYWNQTGRRHYSKFYERLSNSAACACFGGEFQNCLSNKKGRLAHHLRKIDRKFHMFKPDRVFQFDSWRFWESLAAGACTIHVDFEKYGAALPEMPINGKQYIGVDFNNLSIIEELLSDERNIREIGIKGREWAFQHYTPKQIALRFLNVLAAKEDT